MTKSPLFIFSKRIGLLLLILDILLDSLGIELFLDVFAFSVMRW